MEIQKTLCDKEGHNFFKEYFRKYGSSSGKNYLICRKCGETRYLDI